MLRYGDTTVEVKEGDAISFPQGEQVAHQFYNHVALCRPRRSPTSL